MQWFSGNRYLSRREMEWNAKNVWNYLGSRGWSLTAVCGVLGNMQSESTINPGVWEHLIANDWGAGFGLVQWTPAIKYVEWAGPGWNNGDRELDRLIWEKDNEVQWFANPDAPIEKPPLTFAEFSVETNIGPDVMADYFLWYYEHPEVVEQPARGEQALEWYTFLEGDKPFPTPSDSQKLKVWMYNKRFF